jgi:hypothetical protein
LCGGIFEVFAPIWERCQTLSVEMTAIRQHLAGVVTIQEHDQTDISAVKVRLDRIEKRLELAE